MYFLMNIRFSIHAKVIDTFCFKSQTNTKQIKPKFSIDYWGEIKNKQSILIYILL